MNLSSDQKLLLWLILIPLIGALSSYLCSFKRPSLSGYVASLAALLSAICAGMLFFAASAAPVSLQLWDWMSFLGAKISFEFVLDRLSAVMALVITGIGTLIHVYSIAYMSEDESRPRFFAYLNLFLFSMLVLVLAANMPVAFIGWEGVGLCSYLLIGFWFTNKSYAFAGQKAFVVNRIGDVGFILAMLILASYGVSLTFSEMAAGISQLPSFVVYTVACCLFLAAAGKSAQLPLFVWLPDAMAGPTPVSALIHAATMVTAGIYLFARAHVIPDAAPAVQYLVLSIGTLTALIGATSAVAQRDIKKVLAYSTVSQLGFMFMAVGVGAYSVAMFHVVTHAFFKALLFLSAGSVIHGCHHEQLMEKFGGLWKKMPVTFVAYLVGTIAISGLPFVHFSGAISKDYILERVITAHHLAFKFPFSNASLPEICWVVALFTAALTAFYMFKSLILTFFGTYRGEHPPHESPPLMTGVLLILAIPSAAFGALYGEKLLGYLELWNGTVADHSEATAHMNELIVGGFALAGALLSVLLFGLPALTRIIVGKFNSLRPFFERAWGFDDLYKNVVCQPLSAFGKFLIAFDRNFIDGFSRGIGAVVEATGEILRRTSTGRISQFVPTMIISFGLLITFLVLIR